MGIRNLRRLVGDKRGGIALITALSAPLLIGGAGMAVDTVNWAYMRRAMQHQADLGALAGTFALAQQHSVAETVSASLTTNNNVALTVAPVIESAPTAGPLAGNARAVRVVLATDVRLPFVGIAMGGPIRITAEATAQAVSQGQYCVLSLENGNVTGITMSGNAVVSLGCGLMTNAPAASAIAAGGSSMITASPVSAVGGLPLSGNYAEGTQLIPYAVPQYDPLSSLPNPAITSSTNGGNVNPSQTKTLSPGSYAGMDLKGTVTLRPGVYYIDGGSFSVGSQAQVSGNGVTIVLSSRTASYNPQSIATININGGAMLNITAPSSGPFMGVLIYQDRRALDGNQSNKINGNSASKLQGTVYFPGQAIEFTGTTGMNIDCVQLVARRVTFTGNSRISNTCPAGSGASSFYGTRVKLVA